ncbi:MAG TPA: DUF1684 domain-containing protein [Chthoniobacterales bacterium]|jgi:hypothetical protein
MKKTAVILCALALVSLSSARAQSDYVKAIEKWRAGEEADLKKPDGWLTLAGLFWLKDGVNTVGAGPQFDVRLTDHFKQGKFGEIDFKNGVATLHVASGVEAQCDGKPVSTLILVSDAKGKPAEIHTGTETFYLIQREDRFGIRLKDNESKARLTFKGQRWFPIDEGYRVIAHLEAFPEAKELMVPNVLGGHFKMKSPGLLKFALEGKEYSLQPVLEDDGSLFLIFRDQSNLSRTDETGRFLYADKPVNGDAVLDFNKAENPPCAFTPYATCPLAPPGNDLKVAINAGEKRYEP